MIADRLRALLLAGSVVALIAGLALSRTGVLAFRPRDMVSAIKQGAIVPCNGIAMGCSLYRMSMFKDVPRPWFKTSSSGTQDLHFCSKAASAGKRFAVDSRVRVGHMDLATGEVF